MSKHGLGRGLSSLFNIYEDEKPIKKADEKPAQTLKDTEDVFFEPIAESPVEAKIEPEKKSEKNTEKLAENNEKIAKNSEKIEKNTEKTVKTASGSGFSEQKSSDALQSARELLEKLNAKNTAPKEIILPKDSTELYVNAEIEAIENKDFLKSKHALEEKLKFANRASTLQENVVNNSYRNTIANSPDFQPRRIMEIKQPEPINKDGVQFLPIGIIEPNPDQPRKNFDMEAMKELAQSIKLHGIIQPIVVSPRGNGYIIIAGERRWRASKMVGLKEVPVVITGYQDDEMNEIALIENLQREDLNPIETAYAMKSLIDNFGFSPDELAKRLGKNRSTISNTMRLLNLCPEVKALVEHGKLAPNSARALLSITDHEVQLNLAKKACNDKMTTRELEQIVREMLSDEKGKKKEKAPLSSELLDFKENMQRLLGTKVTFLGDNNKGRIFIDYHSRDDLDRIYTVMSKLKNL